MSAEETAPAHDPKIVYKCYSVASRKFIDKWRRQPSKQELVRDPIYLAELQKLVARYNAMSPERRTKKHDMELKTAMMALMFPMSFY